MSGLHPRFGMLRFLFGGCGGCGGFRGLFLVLLGLETDAARCLSACVCYPFRFRDLGDGLNLVGLWHLFSAVGGVPVGMRGRCCRR